MNAYFYVGLGSAIGGMLRYSLSGWIAEHFDTPFPWGTIFVNVTGSFCIGLTAELLDPHGKFLTPPWTREFVMVGILGGYTTFSAFSLQTLNLVREGQWLLAGANVLLSVMLCLAAVGGGVLLARAINQS